MRLTVLEFAERYRIKEADASKLLRRARWLVNVAWLHGGARARPRCPKSD